LSSIKINNFSIRRSKKDETLKTKQKYENYEDTQKQTISNVTDQLTEMVKTVKSPIKCELSKDQLSDKETQDKLRAKKLLKEITRKMNTEKHKIR